MNDIDRLIQALARLPGLGPRSARRAVLHMLKRKETVLAPLLRALTAAAERIQPCRVCGNLDTSDPCGLCRDERRDPTVLCVVEDVADLWALERTGGFRGLYHVLGGTLSALGGVGPEDLRIPELLARVAQGGITEVIIAVSYTVEGQTTAHYLEERLAPLEVTVSGIAHGVPLGGELHYLDDATLITALRGRRRLAR